MLNSAYTVPENAYRAVVHQMQGKGGWSGKRTGKLHLACGQRIGFKIAVSKPHQFHIYSLSLEIPAVVSDENRQVESVRLVADFYGCALRKRKQSQQNHGRNYRSESSKFHR